MVSITLWTYSFQTDSGPAIAFPSESVQVIHPASCVCLLLISVLLCALLCSVSVIADVSEYIPDIYHLSTSTENIPETPLPAVQREESPDDM